MLEEPLGELGLPMREEPIPPLLDDALLPVAAEPLPLV
jgi:hypothetical protein